MEKREIPTSRPEGLNRQNKVVVFTVKGGEKVFRLNKDRVVIGTVVSADVRLTGEGVAPIHAVVEVSGDGATIFDLASDSGVFVNNSKVVTHALKDGDEISVGKHRLEFRVDDVQNVSLKERVWQQADGRALFYEPKEDFKPIIVEDERSVSDLFDYKPSQTLALEVIMSWFDTILDVEHFVKEKSVTLGTKRSADFGIPPLLQTMPYAIITRQGDSYALNLTPEMKGVLQRGGSLRSFTEIRETVGKSGSLQLEKDDFAKVSIGDIDFYLGYTPAPPRLRKRRGVLDPLLIKSFAASIAITGVLGATVFNMEVSQNIEAEQLPERVATILYQPEKFVKPVVQEKKQPPEATPPPEVKKPEPPKPKPEPPKPKPTVKVELKPQPVPPPKKVPEKMNIAQKQSNQTKQAQSKGANNAAPHAQNQAKEGEGARAKGTEGTRGQKNAPKFNTHQDAANRPSPDGGTGKGGGNSEISEQGNIDILKGASAQIQNMLGNAGEKLGKGGEKLKGFGGFTSQGGGGLALSGSGKGGGGDAETNLGGLGKKGNGGGRVGTGLGAAGNGTGLAGGASRVALRTGGPEEVVVMGAIDQSAILAALMAHRDEFRLCYEREINAETPNLAGQVIPTWVIGASGRVTQAGLKSSTLKNSNTERCVIAVIRRIQFPIPEGAGVVEVSFPFKFSPVGN